MTSVGIVGGLGPESTVDYYRRILAAWEREDPASAPAIVIDSLDVHRALRLVASDRPALAGYVLESLQRVAGAGVDFAVLSANTPTSSSTRSVPDHRCRSSVSSRDAPRKRDTVAWRAWRCSGPDSQWRQASTPRSARVLVSRS